MKSMPTSLSAPELNPSTLYRDDVVSRVPPLMPSARTALFSKYTPTDWFRSNNQNYRSSDMTRSAAQRLRDENVRICHDTDARTVKTQQESSKNLGNRLQDINFWKSELNHEPGRNGQGDRRLGRLEAEDGERPEGDRRTSPDCSGMPLQQREETRYRSCQRHCWKTTY